MVVIKQYSNTQITSLNSLTGRVLYDSTLNVLRFNDSASYNNILLFKDTSNNVSGLNNVTTTGNINIGGNSSLTGTLNVTGYTTLSSTTDATSSTVGGALTILGGVGIAKKLFVGTNLSVGGNSSITGTLGVTGATTLSNTLGVTGATSLSSTLGVTGATSLLSTLSVNGVISLADTTDATSNTAGGCLTVSGGTAIAKKLFVGGNTALTGTLGVTAATTLSSTLGVTGATTLSSTLGVTGAATLSNTLGVTGATTLSSTLGVTAATTLSSTLGVTGVVTLSNVTDATSSTAGGCLTISGGTAIAKSLFVGTDATAGSLILTSTEAGSGSATAFNTLAGTAAGSGGVMCYDQYNDIAMMSTRTYFNSSGVSSTVSDGTVLTNYQTANGFVSNSLFKSQVFSFNNGNFLFCLRMTDASGNYSPILAKGTKTSLTSVIWKGPSQTGANAANANIISLTAKDENNIILLTNDSKMYYTTNGSTFIENTSKPANINYEIQTGSLITWASGFNKYLVGTTTGVSYSSDGITWYSASIPSAIDRTWIYYNVVLNKAFAYCVNTASLIVSSDGITWTNVTLPASGYTLGGFINNINNNGLVAIYPHYSSMSMWAIYSLNGTTWFSTSAGTVDGYLPGQTFNNTKIESAVFKNNTAMWATFNGGYKIARTVTLISASSIFKLNYLTGGYIANQSKTGHIWYSSSTSSSTGNQIMALDTALTVTVPQSLTNVTDSSSTSTGALIVAGGVGISKNMNVGNALAVTGATSLSSSLGVTGATTLSSSLGVTGVTTLSSSLGVTGATTLSSTLNVTGAATFLGSINLSGALVLNNTTDATSSTDGGCLTIAGGTAIAKKLFVGGNTVLTGTLGVAAATTLSSTLGVTGATTLSSTLDVTGATTLSSTLGVTGAATLSSTLSATGAITFSNTTDASSSTIGGCVTISGGTAIAKKLFVGTDLAIGGNSTLTGTLGVTGATTLSSTLDVTGNSVLTGSLGVGTSAPDKKVEINSSTGDCLRLTYNDADGTATNYTDMLISSAGNLTITPSGGNLNLSSHNGSTTGLKLNDVLVTATANELNYNDTSVGTGVANKAVILDSNRNFINLNYIEAHELAIIKTNSANNTVDYPISLSVVPSTTAVVGLGTGIEINSVNNADELYNAGYINYISTNITAGSETGFLEFKVANVGGIDSVATISNNGILSVTSLVETSDIRSKENIQETLSSDSLEKILNVNVKTYNYIKDNEKRHHIGVIAQEIKEIIPESVVISKSDDFEDFHQVQYTALVPHLINCIKELNEEIKALKAKLN